MTVKVRCGGDVGLVKCGRGCAEVGAWVWLWASVEEQCWGQVMVGGGRYVRR